jgi:hypothetical protein
VKERGCHGKGEVGAIRFSSKKCPATAGNQASRGGSRSKRKGVFFALGLPVGDNLMDSSDNHLHILDLD